MSTATMADNDYAPYASEDEALDAYRDALDEACGDVVVMGVSYPTSLVLERVDPIAFRTGFIDCY